MLRQKVSSMEKVLSMSLACLFVVSLTATVISATEEHRYEHQGGYQQGEHRGFNQGEHNFRNWHEHRHHRHHDHYYDGTYYPDYEWVYNPETLVWDWTYMPVAVKAQPLGVPVEAERGDSGGRVHHGGHGGHGGHGAHHHHEDNIIMDSDPVWVTE